MLRKHLVQEGRLNQKDSAASRPLTSQITSATTDVIQNKHQSNIVCACGGPCPKCQAAQGLQAKLQIGLPNDKYEKEADQVADQVMHTPLNESDKSLSSGTANGTLQRQTEIEDNKKQANKTLQAKASTGKNLNAKATTKINTHSSQSNGQPLPRATKTFFESCMSSNFDNVRIHTNATAAEAARSINARAYTLGNNIVFGASQFLPDTQEGKHLIAHELVHVQQQNHQSMNRNVIQREILPGESEGDHQLRQRVLELIPGVLRRLRYAVARGRGGLYPFENMRPDGRIESGGLMTLSERRQRLLSIVSDLTILQQQLAAGQIPAAWLNRLADEQSGGRTDIGEISRIGAMLEALMVFYEEVANQAGRSENYAFFNFNYLQAALVPQERGAPFDTGIDVIAPYANELARVERVGATTSIIQNEETAAAIGDQPIHRVYRDARGYYYQTGPAWQGPLRRIDLPGRP